VVAQLVDELRYKPEESAFDSLLSSLKFLFI
jgi:hypothetical protein